MPCRNEKVLLIKIYDLRSIASTGRAANEGCANGTGVVLERRLEVVLWHATPKGAEKIGSHCADFAGDIRDVDGVVFVFAINGYHVAELGVRHASNVESCEIH